MLAMIAHLGGIVTSFIAPLVIWQMKKAESAFIEDQAKEALNFQITVLIAAVVLMVITVIPFIGCLAMPLWLAMLGALVLMIMGGIKANDGVRYRYPVNLRLIK